MAQKAKPDLDDPRFWLAIADECRRIANKIEGPPSRLHVLMVAENYGCIARRTEEHSGSRVAIASELRGAGRVAATG